MIGAGTFLKKNSCGRRGLPAELVAAMYADYQRLGSARKAGKLHGRSGQMLDDIFKRHGLALKPGPKAKAAAVWWQEERWSPDHQGFFRSTTFASRKAVQGRLLHRVKWERLKGPIPKGHVVCFKDFDRGNCELENLACVSRGEHRKMMAVQGRNRNAWTVFYNQDAAAREKLEAALRGGDAQAISRARAALAALKKPEVWDETRRTKFSKVMRKMWKKRTPADRAALSARAVATRRERERKILLNAMDGGIADGKLANGRGADWKGGRR